MLKLALLSSLALSALLLVSIKSVQRDTLLIPSAGADIKEMKDKTFADAYGKDFIENWSNLTRIKKPIIAAVNGFAVSIG